MSITLEFYAAEPEAFLSALLSWFSAETDTEADRLDQELHARYPHADFSLHLHWPEDIDAFCSALVAEGLDVPATSNELLVEELWFDGLSAWVDRISQKLPLAIASVADMTIKRVAERWVKSYLPDTSANPLYYTTAYNAAIKAISELRVVSQVVCKREWALLLFRMW